METIKQFLEHWGGAIIGMVVLGGLWWWSVLKIRSNESPTPDTSLPLEASPVNFLKWVTYNCFYCTDGMTGWVLNQRGINSENARTEEELYKLYLKYLNEWKQQRNYQTKN